jgi:Putative prokaryotic signal transducing protein
VSRTVPIGSFGSRSEAEIVVGLLESEGIAATVSTDDAGGAYPFDLAGGPLVLVDERDAEAAREALARRDA